MLALHACTSSMPSYFLFVKTTVITVKFKLEDRGAIVKVNLDYFVYLALYHQELISEVLRYFKV